MFESRGRLDLGQFSYVLMTAARNEEDYIEHTLRSVVAQTVKPKKWVIVSDGSTDRTDAIIKGYQEKFDWISLLRMPEHEERDFAAKARCLGAAWKLMENVDYSLIGNCDADISFEPDYVEFLLDKFRSDPRLGVAGTPFVERDGQSYDYRFTNIEHVSGGFQLFRRACFEEIGGFTPIKVGGEDWIAVTSARMMGWTTRTFSERTYDHLKLMGSGERMFLASKFKSGYEDYLLGNHPFWEFFRAIYQLRSRPVVFGSLARLIGYAKGALGRPDRPISEQLVRFNRKEQIARLKEFFRERLRSKPRKSRSQTGEPDGGSQG